MKLNTTIASVFLVLAGAIGANAQLPPSQFSVVVTPPTQAWTGSPLIFGGTITNTTGSTLNLVADSVIAPSNVNYTDEFAANVLPISLAPGQSYGPVSDLFTITSGVTSSFTGTFAAFDFTGMTPITGYGDFQVTATTPEPGCLALLLGCATTGTSLLRRRRR